MQQPPTIRFVSRGRRRPRAATDWGEQDGIFVWGRTRRPSLMLLATMLVLPGRASSYSILCHAFQQTSTSHRDPSPTKKFVGQRPFQTTLLSMSTNPTPITSEIQKNPSFSPLLFLPKKRKSNHAESTMPPNDAKPRSRTMGEMVALSIMGVTLATGIVYILASRMSTPLEERAILTSSLEEVTPVILEAAFPLSASEVVTGSLGEATAGIVAAGSSLVTSTILSRMMEFGRSDSGSPIGTINQNDGGILLQNDQIQRQQQQLQSRDISRKAVADGDFFVTRAAVGPLFETMGMEPSLALLGSVLLATVPAEIVNLAARNRLEKDWKRLEMELIQEEFERQKLQKPFPLNLLSPQPLQPVKRPQVVAKEDEARRQEDLNRETVLVDTISDLIKWLGYGVIRADFSGTLTYEGLPLFPGLESAVFGVIAALSAQIYADCFFAIFGFGGDEKQRQIKSRTPIKWITTYVQVILSSAALFGVYEFAQIPAKAIIASFLSGGAENCYGSADYDLCLEVYLVSNPPGASPEAELRSLVTTISSFMQRTVESVL